jgi:hypothetical protein
MQALYHLPTPNYDQPLVVRKIADLLHISHMDYIKTKLQVDHR